MDDQVTLLGIRHHGPGCAHALVAALEQLRPDLILLEGAAELQDSWTLMATDGMTPPVAQLVYDPQQPRRSVIYPWASFSPEWQAMRYALSRDCRTYDMGAISPGDDPDHSFHGMYRFKTGFGGRIVHNTGSWDYPVRQDLYQAFRNWEMVLSRHEQGFAAD